MKHRFLKDLGIDIDEETEDALKQFNLNGLLDEISDNRLKEKDEVIKKIQDNQKEDE